ncbi:unnamed protein product, partial [Urochloa humidicola]
STLWCAGVEVAAARFGGGGDGGARFLPPAAVLIAGSLFSYYTCTD